MAKKEGFYRQTPAVPEKKIAGTNPIGMVIIGVRRPSTVPEGGGKSRGFGPPSGEPVRPKHVRGTAHYERPPPGHKLGKTEGPQKPVRTLNHLHKV